MKRLLATGTVVAGRVVLDDVEFIDGTQVVVISRNEETAVRLSPAELADFDSHSQALRQARKRQASAMDGISTSATSVIA